MTHFASRLSTQHTQFDGRYRGDCAPGRPPVHATTKNPETAKTGRGNEFSLVRGDCVVELVGLELTTRVLWNMGVFDQLTWSNT
jgi:hypothetical protein